MGTLNTELLVDKLGKLANSQQSIEGLSQWCMFYKKDIKKIIATWDVQFQKASPEKRLAFMYLANDLLQNGRKKATELTGEFFRVLPKAFKTMAKTSPQKDIDKIKRLVLLWKERQVYSPNATQQLLDALNDSTMASPTGRPAGGEPGGKRVKTGYGATVSTDAPEVAFAQSMVTNVSEVSKLEMASNRRLHALSGPCRANLEHDGNMAELKAAVNPLRSYADALTKELKARKLAVSSLKSLLEDQEKGLSGTEQKLQLSK
eukprot:scaffold123816_cov48-Prasinocladus_malaysianus.AAC.4